MSDRLLTFRHYAITDRRVGAVEPRLAAWPPGTLAVQLRDKDLPREVRHRMALRLREAVREAGQLLFIGGGDVALARAVGADGVHLPAGVIPDSTAGLLVGASCHDAVELAAAAARGVDFVTLSPVRAVPGKAPALGWARFAALTADRPLPVFALGGLSPQDLAEAQRHGAWGIAGIRGFLQPGGNGLPDRR